MRQGDREMTRYIFHGGCHGCTQDLSVCPTCKYMKPDWTLPSKNNSELLNKLEKEEMMQKAYIAKKLKETL